MTAARAENLSDVTDMKIVTSSRKPPIVARTLGQRNYVEAIQKHDIVFGIGPAGHGENLSRRGDGGGGVEEGTSQPHHSDATGGGSR